MIYEKTNKLNRKIAAFCSVPRLFNRFYAGIKAATVDAPGLKGKLSQRAVSTKLANMKSGGNNKHAVYDRIWANKVKAGLGCYI